jgi:hypothetical protein
METARPEVSAQPKQEDPTAHAAYILNKAYPQPLALFLADFKGDGPRAAHFTNPAPSEMARGTGFSVCVPFRSDSPASDTKIKISYCHAGADAI